MVHGVIFLLGHGEEKEGKERKEGEEGESRCLFVKLQSPITRRVLQTDHSCNRC